jgi:hypothetical protein
VLSLRRGRAYVHMRGRRCNQAIRPSAWSGVVRAFVCEHGCLCERMYALCHVRSRLLPSLSPISHEHFISIPPTNPSPGIALSNTAMVSQAMVHPFSRPPSAPRLLIIRASMHL